MTFVITELETLAAAASAVQGIGSTISAQNAVAVIPTIGAFSLAAVRFFGAHCLPIRRACTDVSSGQRPSGRRHTSCS